MISVIIPNFNGSEFLPKLLSNLKTIIHPNFEIILVDNGSTDNSLQIFQSLITRHCQLITNSSNLGFAAAVNQGINAATNPYVCLLNNDLILSPTWFNLIIAIGALVQIAPPLGSSGQPPNEWIRWLAVVGIVLTTINMFGGFAVTQRMLAMFRK